MWKQNVHIEYEVAIDCVFENSNGNNLADAKFMYGWYMTIFDWNVWDKGMVLRFKLSASLGKHKWMTKVGTWRVVFLTGLSS